MLARLRYLVCQLYLEHLEVAPQILPLAFAPNKNKPVTFALHLVRVDNIRVHYLLLFCISSYVVGNDYTLQFTRTSCLYKIKGLGFVLQLGLGLK